MQAKEIRYYTVTGAGDEEVEHWDSVVRNVVESVEFDEDFQCMTGGTFLDKSGKRVLWKIADEGTKLRFGGNKAVMNSVLTYQDSVEDAGNDPNAIYRTSADGNDILHMTLPPDITRVKAFDADGEVIVSADFLSKKDFYRYALIVESGSPSPNIPVTVHEISESPHGRFYKDVLTARSFAGTVYSSMTESPGGSPTDMRSGLLLGTDSTQISEQELRNW